MDIITTITIKNVFISPSPLVTEILLANQAPEPFPIAKINPIFQFTLSFNTKTTRAESIYSKTTITFVTFALTKFIRFT